MLGWWIVVSEGQPDGVMIDKANTLASWEAGLSGLRWLNDLVAAGKARKLRSDGYPNRYEARAADVWPLLDEVTGDSSHKLLGGVRMAWQDCSEYITEFLHDYSA